MGYRLKLLKEDDVKMQGFGENVAAANYECPANTPSRGTKRRLEDEQEDDDSMDDSMYLSQRQSIFNISVFKLNRYRQFTDPSLRRSVLICNTLRTIEQEMVSEGMQLNTVASATFLPSIQTDNMTLDPLPSNADYSPYVPLPVEPKLACGEATCDVGYEKSLTDLDSSSGRATPYPSPELDPCRTDSCGPTSTTSVSPEPPTPMWEENDERLPSISWSSVLNFSSQTDVDPGNTSFTDDLWNCDERHAVGATEGDGSGGGGGPNTSPSSSSDSGISTASDEIFGDIDLSLYDFDLLPLSPPNARVAPPSAEELLRSFSNGEQSTAGHLPAVVVANPVRVLPAMTATSQPLVPGAASVVTTAPSPSSSSSTSSARLPVATMVTAGGCHRNEAVLNEELDQIMHVLVGI